jgi:hypothetical protein
LIELCIVWKENASTNNNEYLTKSKLKTKKSKASQPEEIEDDTNSGVDQQLMNVENQILHILGARTKDKEAQQFVNSHLKAQLSA